MKQEREGQRIADGRGAANTLLKALPPVRHEVILKFYYSSPFVPQAPQHTSRSRDPTRQKYIEHNHVFM